MHFFFACGAQNFEFLALRARNSKSQPLGAWELKIPCFGPGTQDPDPPPPPPPRGGGGGSRALLQWTLSSQHPMVCDRLSHFVPIYLSQHK